MEYVDDTTTSEVATKGSDSNAQQLADRVAQWSSDNHERTQVTSTVSIVSGWNFLLRLLKAS